MENYATIGGNYILHAALVDEFHKAEAPWLLGFVVINDEAFVHLPILREYPFEILLGGSVVDIPNKNFTLPHLLIGLLDILFVQMRLNIDLTQI